MLEIDIGYGTQTRRVSALLDSGTELTIVDGSIASLLGVSDTGRQRARVAAFASQKDAFLAPVTLTVPGFNETIHSTVLFVDDPQFDMILGQDDFFRRFLVKFEKSKNRFYLDISH